MNTRGKQASRRVTLLAALGVLLSVQQVQADCWRLANGQVITSNANSSAPVAGAQRVQCSVQQQPNQQRAQQEQQRQQLAQQREQQERQKAAEQKQHQLAQEKADDEKKQREAKAAEEARRREAKAAEEKKKQQAAQQRAVSTPISMTSVVDNSKAKIQCTDLVHNVRPDLNSVRLGDAKGKYEGKAKNFIEAAKDNKFATSNNVADARAGAVVVFDSTPTNSYGHVAVIKEKLSDGSLKIQEANNSGRDPKTPLEAGGPITTRIVKVGTPEYSRIKGYVLGKN